MRLKNSIFIIYSFFGMYFKIVVGFCDYRCFYFFYYCWVKYKKMINKKIKIDSYRFEKYINILVKFKKSKVRQKLVVIEIIWKFKRMMNLF